MYYLKNTTTEKNEAKTTKTILHIYTKTHKVVHIQNWAQRTEKINTSNVVVRSSEQYYLLESMRSTLSPEACEGVLHVRGGLVDGHDGAIPYVRLRVVPIHLRHQRRLPAALQPSPRTHNSDAAEMQRTRRRE
jgi:hypothetical protein